MKHSYYYKHINEGFDIFKNRRLHFTSHYTYTYGMTFDGDVTYSKVFSNELQDDITVYSIYKRMFRDNTKNDPNVIYYDLDNDNIWSFNDNNNKQMFWERFELLLKMFIEQHKNETDYTIVIPCSDRYNKNVVKSIKDIAANVGIKYVVEQGLHTVSTEVVEDSVYANDSYFKQYYGDEWEDYLPMLKKYLDKMDNENDGLFKYHLIDDKDMRMSIINTLEIDKDYAFLYERYVNGKNVLIVDDSITYGQSIRNAIHAIAQAYVPKSVSVLTMFSQFWNNNGEEDEYKIKRFFCDNLSPQIDDLVPICDNLSVK